MAKARICLAIFLSMIAVFAQAQSWTGAYSKGLDAIKSKNWTAARAAFQQAIAYRPEDVAQPTTLPGPITEQRRWRDGAPYSPNFLAAYSGYKAAEGMTDTTEAAGLFKTVAEEFEGLIAKGQNSRETFYFINAIYTRLGDEDKRKAALAKFSAISKFDWRVDRDAITPEDRAMIDSQLGATNGTQVVQGGDTAPVVKPDANGQVNVAPTLAGVVASVPTKFALVIGNSETKLAGLQIPFASEDAQLIRQSLVSNGGYLEGNIDLVVNATAQQIMASAKALADRVPDGATVMIYFAGAGVNIDGVDYLAGVDTEIATDTTSMVSKNDLYRLFMAKGAKIFAFYEANRPVANGRHFGMQEPMVGSIAQAQATMPGAVVTSTVRNGKEIGIYADAFSSVLNDLKSNRIPIQEFGWQLFYKIRRGNSGTTGGGSHQTPTLPVLTNLASDARF